MTLDWVSPTGIHNPTTGRAIPAAWGRGSNNALDWLATNKPSVKATRSSNFTHNSTGNFLTIAFNQEVWDVGGCHSTTTNSERLVAPVGGRYIPYAHMAWSGNVTGRRVLEVVRNGTVVVVQVEMTKEAGGECSGGIPATKIELDAGEWIHLQAYQDSGGDLDITQSDEWTPIFGMDWDSTQ